MDGGICTKSIKAYIGRTNTTLMMGGPEERAGWKSMGGGHSGGLSQIRKQQQNREIGATVTFGYDSIQLREGTRHSPSCSPFLSACRKYFR